MLDSYAKNAAKGYISFAADKRDLNTIPPYPTKPANENYNNIKSLKDARNFLYLINPSKYSTNAKFITAMNATNYDVIIMDSGSFTKSETDQLKVKANGGKRLVISYMSIGEAEDYR